MHTGDVVMLRPTAMAAGGDALARTEDGRVVFVTGALPGEEVAVTVTEVRTDFARGVVSEVLEPSVDRVAPPCGNLARGCGGCQWQHIAVDRQRDLKREVLVDALVRIGRIAEPPVGATIALPAEAYRTTVRAAVLDGRAGYREGASHTPVTVDDCLVAHPLIAELLADGRYPGAREVVLRCGARTGQRLAAPRPGRSVPVVPVDVRFDHLEEELAGRRWRISAASFFQSSAEGAEALVELVRSAADGAAADGGPAGRAVDLYSGVGLFAGTLADRGWRVTAVEGSAAAVADAQVNLRHDDVEVVAADAGAWTPAVADLVVADPSRAGLGRDGVRIVTGTGAPRVVLVSCDPAAGARDIRLLVDAGYRLTSSTPVDLFPHTFHLEAVSVLDLGAAE